MKQQEIIKGTDNILVAEVYDDEKKPYIISGQADIKAIFIKEDGSHLEIENLDLHATEKWKVIIPLSDADSDLLKEGESSFEVEINLADDKKVVQYLKQLNVIPRI